MRTLSAVAALTAGVAALALSGCHQPVAFPASGSQWPAAAVPDFVHQARFAVTDNLSDELSFIAAADGALLGNSPIGDSPVELEGPHHLAASPDGNFIYYNLSNYVPGTGSGPHGAHGTGTVPGSLVKLDAHTMQKLGEVTVDKSPGDVILSKDGAWAFVSHYDLLKVQAAATSSAPEAAFSTLAIIDTATMTRVRMVPICATAHGEGLNADETMLYVTCAQSDELVVVDVHDRINPSVVTRVKVGPTPGVLGTPAYGPYALVVSPKDGTVWVSDNNSADVRVFDPAQMAMDGRSVYVNGLAMFSAFDQRGDTLYVPHQGDDRITAIDTTTLATRTAVFPANACQNAHALVMRPDFQAAVVVCEGDHAKSPPLPGTVAFLDVPSFSISGFVTVGAFPDGAAWLPAM